MTAEVLAGRYEVCERVSRGGQATVLRAIDRQHDRAVALKVYACDDGAQRDALLAEARMLLGMTPHPGLPMLRDDFFVEARYVIVMDWIEGRNLQVVLEEHGAPGLDRSVVIDSVSQVAAALDHLHSHRPPIVHGDVKPANLIRDDDGRIRLVDFGITAVHRTARRAGTRGYVAPEVAADGHLTPAADVYGLAATALALLTGRPPDGTRPVFDGIDPAEIGPVRRALGHGLASDPARRPPSAGALAERLRAGRFESLPRGVVTFLSGDVADAEALWDAHPEAMAATVERLDDLVAEFVDRHDGRIIRSMGGDAWSAVFSEASQACRAALTIHQHVADTRWPDALVVRLRLALHSGEAVLRDGEYHGRAVHLADRLVDTAPAARTIVTQATRGLAADLPSGALLFELDPPARSEPGTATGQLFGLVAHESDRFDLQPGRRDDAALTWMLCADVENSTRLLQISPERYRAAMDRYRRVLAEACADVGGTLLSSVEDIAVISVRGAAEAIAAALAAQHAFEAATSDVAVRVRMGIHVERVAEAAGDPPPPVTATVLSLCMAGHGGQVLLSDDAQRLAARSPAPEVSFLDIGTHQLGGLAEPVRLYQLGHPSLATDFPPPRSLENRAHNLPVQLTRFIGRHDEVSQLVDLLADHRLCTITGIGGSGKTRLALEVASETLAFFPDGIWVADLAGVSTGDALAATIAAELGVREGGSGTYAAPRRRRARSAVDRVVDHFEFSSALVVLDNCEHVLDSCGELVDALLRRCVRIRILATSRAPLGMPGELIYRLGPLALPPPTATAVEARGCASVRLFVDRALLRRPDLALGDGEIAQIAAICRRVDGIPFAIELAAARVGLLGVTEIARTLTEHLGILAGSTRSMSARQPTLRAMIQWSDDLLSERERMVLRRLAVFAGGFDLDAAAHVCAGGELERFDILELLAALVDKSLLESEPESNRFRLLEVTRQYAAERLVDAGEDAVARVEHLAWFLTLAERAETELTGPDQGRWLELLEADNDNLLAALAAGRDASRGDDARLAASLLQFWLVRGRLTEGRAWLEGALAGATLPDPLRAKTLCALGLLDCFAGDYDRAVDVADEARTLAGRLDSRRWESRAGVVLGLAASGQARPADAERHHRAAAEGARASGDRWLCSFTLTNLGNVLAAQGSTAAARRAYQESLSMRRDMGDVWGMTWALFRLGVLATWEGEFDEARALLEESLERATSIGFGQGLLLAQIGLAEALHVSGCHGDASARFSDGLATARELEEDTGAGIALAGLAGAAVADDRLDEAAAWLREPEADPDDDQRAVVARAALLRAQATLARARGHAQEAHQLHGEALRQRAAIGDQRAILDELDAMGTLAAERGNHQLAVTLLGTTERWRAELGFPVPPRDRSLRDAALALLGMDDELGSTRLDRAALALDDGVAIALADDGAEG